VLLMLAEMALVGAAVLLVRLISMATRHQAERGATG
jgi:hypothetical protein